MKIKRNTLIFSTAFIGFLVLASFGNYGVNVAHAILSGDEYPANYGMPDPNSPVAGNNAKNQIPSMGSADAIQTPPMGTADAIQTPPMGVGTPIQSNNTVGGAVGGSLGTGTGQTNPASTSATGNGQGIYIPTNTGLPSPSGGVQGVLNNLLSWLLGIVGVLALGGFVISGIQYILATGSEDIMEIAKRNLMYSIIGITVVLASFIIIQAINYALQGSSMF